jgi:hypothetical protein
MGNKKRMYKKGSFLEPNKELTFGGMNKGKYEAAGPVARQMESAKKAKAAAERIEAEKRAKDKTSSTSGIKGVGRPTTMNTSPNVKTKLDELSKAPGPKPAAKKPASTEPKPGTYAYAKKRNPNLDKLIAERKNYAKGSADYNRVQNQINKAYDKGPMRTEGSKVAPKAAPKNTAKPTLQKPAASKPASKPAPKPAAKKPTPTKTPSGGSGMGAVAKENALKKEVQSAKPVDRRAPSKNAQKIANKNARRNKRLNKMQERMNKLKGKMQAGGLKEPKPNQEGLKKLPTAVRNKMGYKMFGGYKKS